MNNNWDKLLLIILSVVVVGLSGWFITKALGFKNQFGVNHPAPGDALPPTDTPLVRAATKIVQNTTNWTLPDKGTPPKPLPLFVSIPIVEVNGRTVDMLNPNEAPIRPPVSNKWLLDNNLDFLSKTVLSQDPDSDGYTNLEEWTAKKDPKDAESHPPYADKLVMIARRSQVYRAKFAARPDDTRFQIQRLPSSKWPQGDNFYLSIGATSEDGQLRLDGYEEKEAVRRGIRVDASVLNVTFVPDGKKYQLVRNVIEEIPTYFAELQFILDGGASFFVKEGDTFPIARDPGTKYRVTKVNEDSAIIEFETSPGQTQTVEIKKK